MSSPRIYRVASRWAIYDPSGILVYVASTHEEEPKTSWDIWTGWASKDEIADRQRQGYRCIRVYVTIPRETAATEAEIEAACIAYWWASLLDAGLDSGDMPPDAQTAWKWENEDDRRKARENMQTALKAAERVRAREVQDMDTPPQKAER